MDGMLNGTRVYSATKLSWQCHGHHDTLTNCFQTNEIQDSSVVMFHLNHFPSVLSRPSLQTLKPSSLYPLPLTYSPFSLGSSGLHSCHFRSFLLNWDSISRDLVTSASLVCCFGQSKPSSLARWYFARYFLAWLFPGRQFHNSYW